MSPLSPLPLLPLCSNSALLARNAFFFFFFFFFFVGYQPPKILNAAMNHDPDTSNVMLQPVGKEIPVYAGAYSPCAP
jgi:hypothetical protein